MLHDHAFGHDLCVVGDKGGGKSAVVQAFADRLGYVTETLSLYKDMTARDLLQRRGTDPVGLLGRPNPSHHTSPRLFRPSHPLTSPAALHSTPDGSTIWLDSPLVSAARHGRLVVLDGLERLPSDVLNSLQRLLQDRHLDLCDGTALSGKHPPSRGDSDQSKVLLSNSSDGGGCGGGISATMHDVGAVMPIHPSFRVVALAAPPTAAKDSWLTPETSTLFRFHSLGRYSAQVSWGSALPHH